MSQVMHSEAFTIYALSAALIALNMLFLAFLTGATRGKNKSFMNPEDKGFDQGTVNNENVSRITRAHRNAIENAVPFFAMGLLYALTVGSPMGAKIYFGVFVTARWLHSIFYLSGKQPFRTMSFAIGALAVTGMAIQVLIFCAQMMMK